jgi:Cft2 family RNA processing exonuclease
MTAAPAGTALVAAALPGEVRQILTAALQVIAGRMTDPVDVDGVLAQGRGVRQILELLCESAGLRRATAARAGGLVDPLAVALVGPDGEAARRAAAQIRADLEEARRAARRAARADRRGTLAERAAARTADTLAKLRTARDQARAQAELAQQAARAAQAEADDLRGDLADALERAATAEAALAVARRSLDSVVVRSESLPAPPARTDDLDLTVTVLGGEREIGGSCVLVTAAGTRLLVDAGARPNGSDAATMAPPRIAAALAEPLHGIVVTHAHNDHAGWVPAVLAAQPDIPVFVTEATAALLSTMWVDTARVLARRASEAADPATAPYTLAQVRHAISRLRTLQFGQRRQVGPLWMELFPAGHIVGAAGVVVGAGDRRVVVSGDVSGPGQLTVGGIAVPAAARDADLLLLESTYAGAGRQLPREHAVAQFVRDVSSILDRGGRVLVPAFALGRAQEVAMLCAEQLPDVPVLVDGLARDVAEIYETQAGPDGQPLRIFGSQVRPVPPGGTRRELARLRTGIVIATSGMLNAGPAVTWARELLPDPAAGIMVVGYQDEESPGGRLLALAEAGGGQFPLPGSDGQEELVPVAARVARYGLGAHAGADELVTIAATVAAREVLLVHGEPRGQLQLRERLQLRGQATAAPGQVWRA